jgi:hypothetical protein
MVHPAPIIYLIIGKLVLDDALTNVDDGLATTILVDVKGEKVLIRGDPIKPVADELNGTYTKLG